MSTEIYTTTAPFQDALGKSGIDTGAHPAHDAAIASLSIPRAEDLDTRRSIPRSGRELAALNLALGSLGLDEFLAWTLASFGDRVAPITSFGASGIVILDHLLRRKPNVRVITLDTQLLFGETYEQWDAIERRYGIRIETIVPSLTPEQQQEHYGPRLWSTEPDICCDLRKVQPMRRAVHGLDAWITGIRRDQGASRANTELLAWDQANNLFKISPLAFWTREEVWAYIRQHNLPYNALHDRGFGSIGCVHCTVASGGKGERDGRWAGMTKTECGLHAARPQRPQIGGCLE